MLKILTKRDQLSTIYEDMLLGRAQVFRGRMKWSVEVLDGKETDWYDLNADPIYIVYLNEAGSVLGSLRLLPTTGPTMLSREFRSFFRKPISLQAPMTWECTRFCVHRDLAGKAAPVSDVSIQLLSGLCDLARASGIQTIVGVYELPMERVYRRLGWSPKRLATSWPRFGSICCGSWEVSESMSHHLHRRAIKIHSQANS
ncbi:acyl-homoserine-lactone synthase [Shinella sp.]|jgi:acyl homoserine lactone synthase|uniref:acyl-homoserine-lactone synthase n=1 Tax=Shinella sp. TaxID=1870904 RepID=UPI003D29C08B